MDGMAGLIHSGDDFGVNSAGIIITETTIGGFSGFDPNGVPEFVRARKAMQYSSSIDDFARIMKDGNNGGYANNWLVADRKNNEVASLELGLKNVTLQRTRDGFFVGSNFPADAQAHQGRNQFRRHRPRPERQRAARALAGADGAIQGQDRRGRGREIPGATTSIPSKARTIRTSAPCAGTSIFPRAACPPGSRPYAPAGAVQNKVADAAGAEKMSLTAALGHACGLNFKAAAHLGKHPEFAWMKDLLRNMDARPWTRFAAR